MKLLPALACGVALASLPMLHGAPPAWLNAPVDVAPDFADPANTLFVAHDLVAFDPATGAGRLRWKRSVASVGFSFNNAQPSVRTSPPNEWPPQEYAADPELPFFLEFISPRTIRVRLATTATNPPPRESLMLVRRPERDASWSSTRIEGGWEFRGAHGSVVLREKPWSVEFRDAAGRLLTSTRSQPGGQPFCFVRRGADYSRSVQPVLSLSPGEKLVGGGESFSGLDKRGQRLVLSTTDALGVESRLQYKPVPFFLSNRGYGVFFHTSAPLTADLGATQFSQSTISLGDDEADLFVFLGPPKDALAAYTDLTGRPPLPPLWSFGLWMSRITYSSETEVRDVAAKLRAHRIPCDVIHLDTGWFETDWHCDYEFSHSRFTDAGKMIADLRRDGFRVSLWQLPYFVPKNKLFPEIIAQCLHVKDAKGGTPREDAVLDFSNPATVAWYQEKLAGLLRLGVGAIKVDFGEAAPFDGVYASGSTGFYEHNLYPMRYQKTVMEVTERTNHESIIWARAAWAGSQRYPIHWGGDSHTTDGAMAATLRGGLSFGASGFSFWSHDIGGFFGKSPEELYRRWLPFGMLTSHSRCHGSPPKEPWPYGEKFTDEFRRTVELKYRLMPYVYAQAKDSADRGLPMLRALLFEFPDDASAWTVDDEYLFGSSLLVAPLLEANTTARDVYLPAGKWIDYQTGRVYAGGWHRIEAGPIPIVLLVRDGTALPHIALAQSTAQMDWSQLELVAYSTTDAPAHGLVFRPGDSALQTVTLNAAPDGQPQLAHDPFAGKVKWNVHRAPTR